MTKIQSKPVPAPTVHVDNFRITSSCIEAYTLIDGESKDWSINQSDFESFVDDNDLRSWERFSEDGYANSEEGEYTWPEIYSGYELMEQFLKAYVEFLFEQEGLDFQPALNTILSTHKSAI